MDHTINNAIEETRNLSAKAKEIALNVVLKVGVPNVEPQVLASTIIAGIMNTGGKELTIEAYRAGKQASYDIISQTAPTTPHVKIPDGLSAIEKARINAQIELWEKMVMDVSTALINSTQTWVLGQRLDGRSEEEIDKTLKEDVESVSDTTGLPNGRVTGALRSQYVKDYEDYILNIEREGQMFGFSGKGAR